MYFLFTTGSARIISFLHFFWSLFRGSEWHHNEAQVSRGVSTCIAPRSEGRNLSFKLNDSVTVGISMIPPPHFLTSWMRVLHFASVNNPASLKPGSFRISELGSLLSTKWSHGVETTYLSLLTVKVTTLCGVVDLTLCNYTIAVIGSFENVVPYIFKFFDR